ncbi:MAG: trehalose-phosphatase [bacterium]
MNSNTFKAIILDLDGVITRTASVHARAWKQVFDEYLEKRRENGESIYQPFDIVEDYRGYVDGKPRYEGVRSFLNARGISLPEGTPDSQPGWNSICAIGNRKNEIFNEFLIKKGPEVFTDAVEKISKWKEDGFKIAVVSSSKNCKGILKSAKVEHLFDVRVDGIISENLGLTGKPAPDIFIQASDELSITPREAVLMEDAEAGVQAGRLGEFGLVVGVAREGQKEALLENGADLAIRSFDDIDILISGNYVVHPSGLPSALKRMSEIKKKIGEKTFPVFLDYDGTLTPIVNKPEDAVISPRMQDILKKLAVCTPTAIVSGRDLRTVQNFIQLNELIYAGSHGFDISMPDGTHMQNEQAKTVLSELDDSEKELQHQLDAVPGAQVERKQFAVAVHYRNVSKTEVSKVKNIVEKILSDHDGLRKGEGKMVLELQPDIDWHKGKAVFWLLDKLNLNQPDVFPFYLGDDITDEDAILSIQRLGAGILVGEHGQLTAARYGLENVNETGKFLEHLIQ